MAHDHHHHDHAEAMDLRHVNRAFVAGIILNISFVVIEAVIGFTSHSLSLLSDAGHNLADVGSLALSLLAFRLIKVKSNERFTYGYRKTSVLAALANCIILLISLGAIVVEAVQRFFHPQPLQGFLIAIVAAVGIIINALSAFLFSRHKEKDINVKSAYMHLMADAVISAGVAVAGVVIYYTGWYWLDAAISIAIAVVILIGTWGLLLESFRMSMDAVPSGIDMSRIKEVASEIEGIIAIDHVHVWALSTTENALTAHIIIDERNSHEDIKRIKEELRHRMLHEHISHVTIETETLSTRAEGACEI